MPSGGAREGAGRKKGTTNKYVFADLITDDDVELTKKKLMERINGVQCTKYNKDDPDEPIIYDVPPSEKAMQIFFDYYFTKPKSETDFTSDGQPITGFNFLVAPKKELD